jgi:restriction endonuclease S subunit
LKKYLKEIASIRSGIFLKPQESGELVYMQAKYFDLEGHLSSPVFPDIKLKDVSEKHILRPGEILFSAKGWKNFAAVYDNSNPPAVASTSFLVISLVTNYIEPRFLAWWLNSSSIQEFLKGMAKGTAIPSITKAQLEALEVPVLPIEVQRNLVKLTELRRKEKVLLEKIEKLEAQKFEMKITKVINSYE